MCGLAAVAEISTECDHRAEQRRYQSLAPSHTTQYSRSCQQDRRMKIESTTAPTREGSMTTATRLGHVLTRVSFGAITSVGLLALSIVESHPVMAQNHGPAALTGIVSSAEEGKMEGIVVSANPPGSTIMISASTNAQGQYSFPQAR